MVSIKTKNSQEAAELMTTMYDASLDELEFHRWEIPRNNIYYNSGNNWTRNITIYKIAIYMNLNLRVLTKKSTGPFGGFLRQIFFLFIFAGNWVSRERCMVFT